MSREPHEIDPKEQGFVHERGAEGKVVEDDGGSPFFANRRNAGFESGSSKRAFAAQPPTAPVDVSEGDAPVVLKPVVPRATDQAPSAPAASSSETARFKLKPVSARAVPAPAAETEAPQQGVQAFKLRSVPKPVVASVGFGKVKDGAPEPTAPAAPKPKPPPPPGPPPAWALPKSTGVSAPPAPKPAPAPAPAAAGEAVAAAPKAAAAASTASLVDADAVKAAWAAFLEASEVLPSVAAYAALRRACAIPDDADGRAAFDAVREATAASAAPHRTKALILGLANNWKNRPAPTRDPARMVISGAGPVGLRAAVEAALMGMRVHVLEKRDEFSRVNILMLWQGTADDLVAYGARTFYPKFNNRSIDGAPLHLGTREIQVRSHPRPPRDPTQALPTC